MSSTNLPGPLVLGALPMGDGSFQATVWVGANYERSRDYRWASPERYTSKLAATWAAWDYLSRIEQVGGTGFMQATLRLRPAGHQH